MTPLPRFSKIIKAETKPHQFCPGCGHPVVLKMLGQAIEELNLEEKAVLLVDIGCSLLAWDFFNLPTSQTHHGRTVPVAVGLKMADPDKIVIAYVGDGGAYAIGLQHTLTSCLRDDAITTIVVNNTLYAMTGGQLAPTTIDKQVTTTTPGGKTEFTTLKGPELLTPVAHSGAFIARGTSNQPLALKQYLKNALKTQIEGHYSLVESLSACPTNWKTGSLQTIQKMELLTKIFPLGEFSQETKKQ